MDLLQCVAVSYFSFCYLQHSCATCVIFDPEKGLTDCVKDRNCIGSTHLWTEQLFCSLLWTVWMFGWLGSCLSMVHYWLGPPWVCMCMGEFCTVWKCRWVSRAIDVGWLGTSLVRLWQLFWYLAFIIKASVCGRVWLCACGLPPHLVPPQPATHMQTIVHSDSKRCTHLYAFIRV